MALNKDDVTRMARLARIELPAERQDTVLAELDRIFGLIGQLRAVDTTGVEPLAHPLSILDEVALRLRDDAVTEPNTVEQRDRLMANAPAAAEGLFLVPRVIE